MAFDTILVANRGEIAARVIRSAQALGLRAVAVYTTADAQAPHVALADEAVWIGDGPVGDSYLDAGKILAAAQHTGAGAIHPGYGFLSENSEFAAAVEAAGLVFVGPEPQAILSMGNKAEAKRLMIAAGVPCVPGYEGADQADDELIEAADGIGFPIMVKAAAGGGGRGMRLVQSKTDLAEAISLARSEAENAFGSGELILERAIIAPRHVEIQVFADSHGAVIHLGERDCSVQRRHQKVVEEAPCPVMTPDLRAAMGAAAVNAARAVNYRGAGTVEFLLDEAGQFYFLEMNTRLQVEHPVTELVTGLDLVAMQIAVAQGDHLSLTQDDVTFTGHAIEVRLYAEDPANDYLPATGPIDLWHPATGPGVRVDSGVVTGQDVSPFYDPMLAKIIAHGPTRQVARTRLIKAVRESVLLGTVTNSAFLADVLDQKVFAQGEATTAFLDQAYPTGFPKTQPHAQDAALALALLLDADAKRAREAAGYVSEDQLGWSSAALLPLNVTLTIAGQDLHLRATATLAGWTIGAGDETFEITLTTRDTDMIRARVNGKTVDVVALLSRDSVQIAVGAERMTFSRVRPGAQDETVVAGGRVSAPMPGLVVDVTAQPGQTVTKGDTLAVLEAMKMQHQIMAAVDGTVSAVHIKSGQQLTAGDVMIEIEET
ncbi:3-methylcrotonyl-CoA carboxylase [Phaeobacter gallaeciensis]|uniref:3-methylcrotonyl-CoA carboxylase n=2 Tax=Roseobacteraceae TaxID=2854170 RepID=A0A366X6G3_9RHOB|nr:MULTISPECIES: acetyl-CoA carboxylase biotin carboxylase subunit [Roseobacteraceae]MBT3143277.1 acetyl-CoA carboxylase biotin carboxylase subunit [Falsiruegeria litorea]MBT8167541.1 acetyl-CoA carboxylase biotin carboxylase subunit [Falsiruegeria litorea]RBW57927.1 3-methylcrotonyl-CoA carboxylase [Phaeobacter gallaeciensis]